MWEMTPEYNTILFTQVWEDYNSFKSTLEESPFNGMIDIPEDAIQVTYALLYAKHGNDPIANNDVNQFANKIFSVMFQYAPTWQKRLYIQKKLRDLTDEELLKGSRAIYNNALNPDGGPATQSLEELPRINSQNTTNYKKSRMDAYSQLWGLLDTNVTADYIRQFRICFKQFVRPEKPILYYEGEDE